MLPGHPGARSLPRPGEPALKPYDQVFLYDSYNDMSGPLEVEQVTHIFSQETGFITVITPDLVVNTNEYLSMSLLDAMATYMGSAWLGYQKKQFASGLPGSLELGDLPWTGVGESKRETFYIEAPLRWPPALFEPLTGPCVSPSNAHKYYVSALKALGFLKISERDYLSPHAVRNFFG